MLQVLCEKKDNDIPLEEIPDEKLSQRFTEFVSLLILLVRRLRGS